MGTVSKWSKHTPSTRRGSESWSHFGRNTLWDFIPYTSWIPHVKASVSRRLHEELYPRLEHRLLLKIYVGKTISNLSPRLCSARSTTVSDWSASTSLLLSTRLHRAYMLSTPCISKETPCKLVYVWTSKHHGLHSENGSGECVTTPIYMKLKFVSPKQQNHVIFFKVCVSSGKLGSQYLDTNAHKLMIQWRCMFTSEHMGLTLPSNQATYDKPRN